MFFLLYFLLFILFLAVILAVVVFVYVVTNIFFIAFITKVPPIQTDKKYFSKIFDRLPITAQTVIYDLGCGGGNFLMAASKLGAKKCVGYELSFWPYLSAKIKAWFSGKSKIDILYVDFFKADLRQADLVYVYLVPPLLERVAKKLAQELKLGAIAAVKGRPLPGSRTYDEKIVLDEKRNYCVYIYKF